MASASSKSARNLFQESKKRLSERVQTNVVNGLGSVTRQLQRGSRSSDMLQGAAKHFCQTEVTMENTFNNLQKMQVLQAQLAHQTATVQSALVRMGDVSEQARDMQR